MTATRSLSATLQHLNRTLLADEAAKLPDAELVGRFVADRDEAAFTALVRRYGLLVFGVCRRVLRHEQDAEDAFQATFLVFARDAANVQRAGAVGNWLYGVAHNVARKARANRLRREVKEQAAAKTQPREVPPVVPNDLPELLDGELGALPDKYRAPIVLCDLLGLTTHEAAAEVGCPPKTLGTRLTRGRSLLARRLTRRGVALSAAALPAALAQSASAAVPSRLLESACTVLDFTNGSATVSPAVAALTTGVSNVPTFSYLKLAAVAGAVLVAGTFTAAPILYHAHAAHAPRSAHPAAGAAQNERQPARPPITLGDVHNLFMAFLPWGHAAVPTAAPADDKKDDKKALSGVWAKKEGETKIEFAGKSELKISPHGKDDVILILCEYTRGKDGLVEAKVTGFEGQDGPKKKLGMILPEGTTFSFKWTVEKGTATLDDVKGKEIEPFTSHLEGAFEEKK